MYRLSDELAKDVMRKIKTPEIVSSGPNSFTYKSNCSVGIIDPTCAVGTEFEFSLECPKPIFYPEFPFNPPGVVGYFLYKREELLIPTEPYNVTRIFVDPTIMDYEEQIEVADCSVIIGTDIDKLTCKTINTIEQLIKCCPTIIDCLELDK